MEDVPAEIVSRLGSICLGLPETRQEPAWVGVRWRVRARTFCHVFTIDEHSPPVLARAAADGGPGVLMAFRSSGPELDALINVGPPFVNAGWGRNAIALRLDEATDWEEVAELLTESYCTMAPQKLQALVDRPGG